MIGKARENENAQESFMSEEQRPLRAFTPESDRIRQCRNRRSMAPDEATTKVYPVQSILLRIHEPAHPNGQPHYSHRHTPRRSKQSENGNVRNLPNIVRDRVEQALTDVLRRELALLLPLLKHLPERTRDHRRLKTQLAIILSIDISHEHIHRRIVASFLDCLLSIGFHVVVSIREYMKEGRASLRTNLG